MGTGVSLRGHGDDDDGLGTDYGHGVIKRIPIEMKPRGRLAGLKSVSSFGRKQPKGGSLRSALSIDLENPEVERIKKDFEMYRLNKDNEITNMQKKEQKCETENKRLRSELLALQKMCTKLRNERDIAWQAEHQALARAAAFESDRDKVQRQFKIFRETKESEIQNLLRAKRDLENKLSKVAHGYIPDDLDTTSREDLDVNGESGNPGDWWTALESEPSFGSTMQLHQPMFRGPEFANSMMETEGPFTNVNKEDWSTASAKLTQMLPSIPDIVPSNVLRVYISAPRDMRLEVEILEKEFMPDVERLCQSAGRTLLSVHMPFNEHQSLSPEYLDRLSKARQNQLEKSTIFLAFLGEHTNKFSGLEFCCGHLDKPGYRPAIFCFRDPAYKGCKPSQGEAKDLKNRVRDCGSGKVIDSYLNPNTGAEMAAAELQRTLKIELGIESESIKDKTDPYSNYSETENPENLCGGALWDVHCDYEQLEALSYAVKSSCQLGFEKYYERLNNHVSAAGPLPPLLVSGAPGSGKSLLLAQWLQLQQGRNLNNVVMYHLVGQDFSVSGDPIVMMRRLTSQLMQHVTSPPALTCDPSRLVEEFPRWLEKVSSKTPGGAILILDSIDRFQQGEQHLKWLLDPLPVDIRVIVSVNEDTCPLTWRSWPTLNIEPLSNKNVKELLRAELAIEDVDLDAEEECKILTHCRTPSTCNPLYVLVLSRAIIGCKYGDKISQVLDDLLQASDTVSLYKIVLQVILNEYDSHEIKGVHKKILRYILLSRNGISEKELRFLIPGLRCNYLAPLGDVLMESLIIAERSGVWTFAHPDAYVACELLLVTDEDQEACDEARIELIQYFSSFLWPGRVTCRVADELPQLIKQTGDKDMMHRAILNLCVFQRLYARGRCAELISYWQFVDADKISMAQQYLEFVKKTEQYVGQFDGIVTLPRIADMNETLGRFLKDLALLSQALPAFQRALELRETALDPDHPAVAKSLHQLAGLHAQWGKFSTAEALYKQALEIYENAFSSDHQMVAKELEALAVLYQKQDKHDLAEPLRKRSMSIRKKMRTPRMAAVQLRGLTTLRRQALTMEELSTGPDSPELARTLNELGVLYYVQSNIDSAEAFFKRSLEIREALLSEDHPDIAQSLKNLAALYNDRKQYDKAVPLYERALNIRNKYLSPDHPSVASIIKHLAMLYKRQGKLSEAVPLYKTAVEIRETSFGDHHPSVATALVNLAVLYSQQNKFSQAEPLYERALHIYEDSLGLQHPRVAETLRNLAVMKYEQRDYETAAKFYKRATEIKESDYTGKMRRSSSDETSSTLKNILQT